MNPEEKPISEIVERKCRNQQAITQAIIETCKERKVSPADAVASAVMSAIEILYKMNTNNLNIAECAEMVLAVANEQLEIARKQVQGKN